MKKSVVVALILGMGGASVAVAMPGGKGGADRAEFREEMFKTLDADGDGQITKAELDGAAKARFEKADANSDGNLTAEELTAAAKERAGERAERRSARMLERLDTNEDGMVSLAEIEAQKDNRQSRLMERADANDDGVVSKEEFMEARMGRGDGHGHGKRHN